MNFYKKNAAEPCSFLVTDITLTIANPSSFRKNANLKTNQLQYNINREAAKISALSSSKIDRYEYLTGEEML